MKFLTPKFLKIDVVSFFGGSFENHLQAHMIIICLVKGGLDLRPQHYGTCKVSRTKLKTSIVDHRHSMKTDEPC
jgi:hypothetical protein